MSIYGYARVSSKGQERYGNSLADQHKQLIEQGVPKENIFEDSYTGTKMDRPNFSKLLQLLRPGDTLVVTKLDRFARTAADGAKILTSLIAQGITVNILNMGKADNTPMGKLLITILLAFAEFERDMIVERTQAGKAQKRQTDPNYREGRPPVTLPRAEIEKFRKMQKDHILTADQICTELHISRATWYKLLKGAAA